MGKGYKTTAVFLFFAVLFFRLDVCSDTLPSTIDLATCEHSYYLKILGEETGDRIGLSVCAGDVNGDGFDDVLICAPPAGGTGKVYVVMGSSDMRTTDEVALAGDSGNVVCFTGEGNPDEFGTYSACGDFNGDGFDDFLVSAWQADPQGRQNAGRAYVLFGSPSFSSRPTVSVGQQSPDILVIDGKQAGDKLGFVVSAGDMDGDGFDDVVLGAMYADPLGRTDAGEVYVVFGSRNMADEGEIDLNGSPDGVLTVQAVGYTLDYADNLGWSLSSGDINGDGFDDLLVGSRFADPDHVPNCGESYVLYGSAAFSSQVAIDLKTRTDGLTKIAGINAHDYTGNNLSAGDLDGDGFDELLINAYAVDHSGRSNAGTTYVLSGSYDFPSYTTMSLENPPVGMVMFLGEGTEDHLGPTSVGDINGDGLADIVQGCLNNDPEGRGNAGSTYIVYGSTDFQARADADLAFPPDYIVRIKGAQPDDRLGLRNWTGDIDGDGYDDAVISAHNASPGGRSHAGEVYIVWGMGEGSRPATRFVFEPNTGNNAIIMIPASGTPTVLGTEIEPGDEIGVFTPGGVCSGAGTWRGDNLAITVWGDNIYKDGINGFIDGEAITFRILDKSERRTLVAHAEFSQGDGVYRIDGISVVSSLAAEAVDHTITLAHGWNVISSYVSPADNSMDAVLSGIAGQLELVKNGKGEIYWPAFSVDQIGEWSPAEGYQVYMNEPAGLVISGFEFYGGDISYSLPAGWSLVGYTGPEGLSPASAFEDIIESITVVKNGAGDVFWPEFGVDDIGAMHRGEGYWISMETHAVFRYPSSAAGKRTAAVGRRAFPSYFTPCARTGASAVILVPADCLRGSGGMLPVDGCEIGVFTESGVCAGTVVYEGGSNCVITVWGDDELTVETDGLAMGEAFGFVVWDAETRREFYAAPVVRSGDEAFTPNGLTILESLSVDADGYTGDTIPGRFVLRQNAPNPFNPSTSIFFVLPGECRVTLSVYNVAGEKVADLADGVLPPGEHAVEWDASGCSSGVYFCRMQAGTFRRTVKMTLVK